jgi:hypothetical protein
MRVRAVHKRETIPDSVETWKLGEERRDPTMWRWYIRF